MATGLFGLDEAWTRTPISELKAAGVHFMARYLSPDSSKNITAAEVRDYAAAGIAIVVVWEGSGNAMLGGYARGVSDAKAAEAQRKAVGLPNDMPIYFACDFDAQGSQYHSVNEYMRGVNDVIGLSRSGFYGGKFTCDNVASAPARASYFWQTIAWSNGLKANKLHIYQDGHTLFSGAADTDYAETADYGQYPRPEEDPLAAFTEAQLRQIVREEASGGVVRDANAFAVLYWLLRVLDKSIALPDPKATSLTGVIEALRTAFGQFPAETQAAVLAAVKDALVKVDVTVSAPSAPAGA